MTRLWVPGWQFGAEVFEPLWQAMGDEAQPTLSYAEFTGSREEWLETTAAKLPADTTLVGWSLGALLACELALRSSQVTKVLVMNSSSHFVGRYGMQDHFARDFASYYKKDAVHTRKRFSRLVSSINAFKLLPLMLDSDQSDHLSWLYQIDVSRSKFSCPIHVLLAEADQLVPVFPASTGWQNIAESITTMPGEHALLWQNPDAVARWIGMHE
ncbi:alpha/beta fold hydrolase [Reinekea marinisedimentorum]|uniref:Alpha/beta hydrolase family protein n=1 Tax=Reinekea marinisedimentorum TaxID=230495 RepID=A0A4R3HY64_9GAMM|nr:alpha/beta hydrolase [Reinekea marinisedimentorum]TCS38142.1 alpha/beta hydrolase family protein [Reinekea marinisedimentorum]